MRPDTESAGVGDASSAEEEPSSLRSAGLRGGMLLMFRGGLGTLLRLGGMLLVTRMIGPYQLGLYASALAFVLFLTTLCQMGFEVYLIRLPAEPSVRTYDTTFTLLLVTSLVGTGLAVVVTSVLMGLISGAPYLPVLRILILSIPLNVCWAPAQARLERRLDYRSIALMELGGDCVLYSVAVPLAAVGSGAWAPTIGFIAWQAFLFVLSIRLAGSVPRLAWDREDVRSLLRFGMSFSLTGWLAGIVGLANPLIVGHYYGPSGVGYVSLTQRILTALGFVNQAVWRLSTVVFGRLGKNLDRVRNTLEETTALQVIAFGSVLAPFAIASTVLIPALFGSSWRAATSLFPVLGLAALLNSVSMVPQSLLYARNRNYVVALAQLAIAVILFAAAALLTPVFGLQGYAIAFLMCQAGTGVILYAAYKDAPYSLGYTVVCLIAFAPILFFHPVPGAWRAVLFLPIAASLIVPRSRRRATRLGREVLSSLRKRRPRAV